MTEYNKGAVVGFIILLCKGLMEDARWNWDVEKCDWKNYQQAFLDPSILKTTLSVFVNCLEDNNYEDARYRAFQYFRRIIDSDYKPDQPFTIKEIEEPDWRIWEN